MAFSMDLRRKVVAAVDRGESQASVARRFEVGVRTVGRLIRRRRETGHIRPDKTGPRGPVKLTEADDRLMRRVVSARPGVRAKQLIPLLSVRVVESTVCRALKRLGLSLKKSR